MRVASARRKRRSWVTNTTQPFQPLRKPSSQSMASMSRWLVGSSSNSTSGPATSARASSTRRFIPPDKRLNSASPSSSSLVRVSATRWSRPQPSAPSILACTSPMASPSNTSAWLRRWNSANQWPSSPRPSATTSNTLPAAPCGTSCSSRVTRTPCWTRTSPSSGLSSPAISFIKVDLPAPLRPIRAIRSPASIDSSVFSSNNGPPTL
ncbi:hypothetical protein D3C81_1084960 [compost metagenome]